jgi:peptide/nickel transport system substrate-binding protein
VRLSRIPSFLTVAAAVALTAAACTGTEPPPPKPPKAASITLATAIAPTTLDPLAGYAPYGAAKIFDGLVEHRPDGSLKPALAVALPRPSTDGLSWTVRLRRNVTFSDATPFGADDVVATYRALLDPAVKSPLGPRYDMLSGVEKVDAHTVRFHLSRPDPRFANLLVLGILPSQALAKPVPAAQSPVGTHPVGTGPYTLARFSPGERLVLKANPTYFGGVPKVTTVTVLLGRSAVERASGIASGAVDGACLAATTVARHGVPDGYRTFTDPAADTLAVALPDGGAVTGDAAVRKALNLVVDRKDLVKNALAKAGTAASTPITDAHPELQEPTATFDHDPATVRSVLAAPGWVAGADGGTRTRGGTAARFPVLYARGDTLAHDLLTRVATDAAKVGIDLEPQAVPRQKLVARAGEDAEVLRTGSPFDPAFTLYPLLHSDGAAVRAALRRARTIADPAQRAVAFRDLQRAYVDHPTMVVLARADHVCLQRTSWTGHQQVTDPPRAGITWGPWWNLARWKRG